MTTETTPTDPQQNPETVESTATPQELSLDDLEGVNGGAFCCPSYAGTSAPGDGQSKTIIV